MKRAAAAYLLALVAPASAHERISTEVRFNDDVSRLIESRCLPCHGEGGSSMRLDSYATARPWAKAIRDEVEARRMPPWSAQPGVGDFVNDRSLSPWEIDVFIAWAEGGAPKGPPSTRPLSAPPKEPELQGVPIVVAPRAELSSGATILSILPSAPSGASVEVRLITADGAQRPLLFIPRFDPKQAERYWVRDPRPLPARAVIRVLGPTAAKAELRIAPRR